MDEQVNKNVPAIRFKGSSENWEKKTLDEAGIKIIDGDRGKEYPRADDFSDQGYCLFLSAKNVTKNGFVFEDVQFITKDKHLKLNNGQVKRGSVVLTTRGSVGNFAFYSKDIPYEVIRINSGMVVLDFDNSDVLPSYFYAIGSASLFTKQIESTSFGSAQPQLTVKIIKDFVLPIPSKVVQQKIGDFFKQLDTELNLHQTKLDKLNTLKKAMLQKMFPQGNATKPEIRFKGFAEDWKKTALSATCSNFRSGDFIRAENIKEEGEYPVYGGNGLRGYTTEYNHDGSYALIGRQGALCGNMNFSEGKAFFTEHAIAVQANLANDTVFLFYKLELMNLGQYSAQSAQPGLSVNKLLELKTLVPEKEEQQKVGAYFRKLDELIALERTQLDKLKQIKQACLTGMFV